jgi:hypothetical protein
MASRSCEERWILGYGWKDWSVPSGALRWTWLDATGLSLEGFNGAIGWEDPAHLFGITATRAVLQDSLRSVLIKLATASSGATGNGVNQYAGWNRETTSDPNMSYAYRYLRQAGAGPARPEFAPFIVNISQGSYGYQDYKRGMPFSAWDIDTTPPRRLAVGFLENNVTTGLVDGCWWPPSNGTGIDNTATSGREWFFIFDKPYTGATPDTSLQKSIFQNSLPVMWMGTVCRLNNSNFSQPPLMSGDDQFLIRVKHPPLVSDVWTFNPTIVLGVGDAESPTSFELFQNYPNPFNPTTTIKYQLATQRKVTIKIFNLLGQEVKTLADGIENAGQHQLQWDGKNNLGVGVATGVYFYRIETNGVGSQTNSFIQVKKMLLIR